MLRSFPSLVLFIALAIAIVWFGVWFKDATDKALAKCTAVEQALGDKCEGEK